MSETTEGTTEKLHLEYHLPAESFLRNAALTFSSQRGKKNGRSLEMRGAQTASAAGAVIGKRKHLNHHRQQLLNDCCVSSLRVQKEGAGLHYTNSGRLSEILSDHSKNK